MECPGLPHGSSRSPAQAGRLYSSLAALMLQQHGRYQRGSPSEICCQCAHLSLQPEEKQKAAQQFSKLQTAMKVLGISPDEQKACWLILAAIYHLGAAGATRGNRAVDPSSLAGHLESWRGPSPLAVGPGPHRLTCYQTPLSGLCLFPVPFIRAEVSKPPEKRLCQGRPEAWTEVAVTGSAVKSRGLGRLEAEGKEKGVNSEQSPWNNSPSCSLPDRGPRGASG